jgi:thiamine biosynthesis lipoprotein
MCDVIGSWFRGKGVTNYMVEIGGEIALLGTNPDGKEWSVGVNVPEEDALQRVNGIMKVIRMSSGGVATSGNYRNFYYRDGKRYAHTIDPRTGYPVQQDIISSTVIAPDCLTADAYATAFMVMGYEKAMEVLAKNPTITAYFVLDDEDHEGEYRVVCNNSLIGKTGKR